VVYLLFLFFSPLLLIQPSFPSSSISSPISCSIFPPLFPCPSSRNFQLDQYRVVNRFCVPAVYFWWSSPLVLHSMSFPRFYCPPSAHVKPLPPRDIETEDRATPFLTLLSSFDAFLLSSVSIHGPIPFFSRPYSVNQPPPRVQNWNLRCPFSCVLMWPSVNEFPFPPTAVLLFANGCTLPVFFFFSPPGVTIVLILPFLL